jgi:multidrug transporter EmrE-like cation transporter
MSFNQIILILLTVVLLSVGQLLFKMAAMDMKNIDISSLLQPKLILALCVYGISTILWIAVLRHTPLRIAYPFVGLAFLIVPVLSWFWMDEQISLNTIVGGTVILIGVWIAVS